MELSQMSILRWAAPATADNNDALLTVMGRAEARSARARELGLSWPPGKRVGRPGRQALYERLLTKFLHEDRLDEMAHLDSKIVPVWWEPGMGLQQPHPDAQLVMEAHAVADQQQHPAEELDEEPGLEPEPKRAKKSAAPRVRVPLAARIWFLGFAQRDWSSWSLAKSLRHAKQLAPDLFRGVHPDTPRRWSLPETPTALSVAKGRKSKIAPAVVQDLSVICLSLEKTNTAFSTLIIKKIAAERHGVEVSTEWVRRLLIGTGPVVQGAAACGFH